MVSSQRESREFQSIGKLCIYEVPSCVKFACSPCTCTWREPIPSGTQDFSHRHEGMHVRLIGDSSVGVHDCLSVLALRQTGDLFTLCLPFLSPCEIYDRLQHPLDCKVDKWGGEK